MKLLNYIGLGSVLGVLLLTASTAAAVECRYYGYVKVSSLEVKVHVAGLKNLEDFPECSARIVLSDSLIREAKRVSPATGPVCFIKEYRGWSVESGKCGNGNPSTQSLE